MVPDAFFGPGGLLAVASGAAIRLVDRATGTEHARLEAPDEAHPQPLCFSPDGALLPASGRERQTLPLWDLRALRAELAARGLDWDRPPYPPIRTLDAPARLHLEFDPGVAPAQPAPAQP